MGVAKYCHGIPTDRHACGADSIGQPCAERGRFVVGEYQLIGKRERDIDPLLCGVVQVVRIAPLGDGEARRGEQVDDLVGITVAPVGSDVHVVLVDRF